LLGTFERGVTVLSQQHRALNLAWALIEAGVVPSSTNEKRAKVAIVGAGFAGLTLTAALLQKRCNCDIFLFEEHDTLLPLQQGSDTRWLHPHIYDWPREGSNASAAMLPVLNWTAARASDVVVQVLTNWEAIVKHHHEQQTIHVFCNARHLQISRLNGKGRLEWVGEKRDPATGTALLSGQTPVGSAEVFNVIILAVGFGLEKAPTFSYWRNETFGQPSLSQPRQTYLVSGQGDGAMIDLFRLKITRFRQDRILDELFQDKHQLVEELRNIRKEYPTDSRHYPLFEKFDELASGPMARQLESVLHDLAVRLRHDTDVILHFKERNIAELLDPKTSRTSFQNALLLYLLYKCGGFTPAPGPANAPSDYAVIADRFAVPAANIVLRHGTDRRTQLERLFDRGLFANLKFDTEGRLQLSQPDTIMWTGGYFGSPGKRSDFRTVSDNDRTTWRKEYLPGPTSLLASGIAGSVAGFLVQTGANHFRVTMHRVLPLGPEDLLQQACDYVGRNLDKRAPTAARTFPAGNATIGVAFRSGSIVRSKQGIRSEVLIDAMQKLELNEASRAMNEAVTFVAAIPLLQPAKLYFEPSRVCGVIYVDSRDPEFFLTDENLQCISTILSEALVGIQAASELPLDRLRNTPLRELAEGPASFEQVPSEVSHALEIVSRVEPPTASAPLIFNFDHSDLTPMMVSSGRTEEPSPLDEEADNGGK
jgi:hypothetical protein